MYLDYATYKSLGGTIAEDEITPKLACASDNVDALTFYRINAKGWGRLTEFQQSQILKACKEQAEFLYHNADAVESAMSSYSINGVSMTFGNASLYSVVSGVPIANSALALLNATGLTCQMATYEEVEPCYIHD